MKIVSNSFAEWPHTTPTREAMAKAGFLMHRTDDFECDTCVPGPIRLQELIASGNLKEIQEKHMAYEARRQAKAQAIQEAIPVQLRCKRCSEFFLS